jgi:hypothetical protein
MAKSSTWEDFGVYPASNKTHNQNKSNTGYNNALYEGLNFSTTLGANFSSVVGSNMSTVGGLNTSTTLGLSNGITLGGKIDLISPWSIKWTKGSWWEGGKGRGNSTLPGINAGGYDYDFKNCQTQVKWNDGTVLNYSANKAIEIDTEGLAKVTPVAKTFAEEAENWLGTSSVVIQSEIRKVMSSNMAYDTMTTTVTGECAITSGGGASAINMSPTGMDCGTQGTLALHGGLGIKFTSNSKVTVQATIIGIG